MKRFCDHLRVIVSSRPFFYGVLAFFIFEAVWMVCTAVYPMAFDEDFHFGIIKIYAQQWGPFLHEQPANADAFGALARDPSYLFHYLMSFPYRLLTHITDNQAAQVIVLRLMNVAFFAWALVLFRRLMLRSSRSPLLVNGSLAVFVLIPIVPQLAAHINYDNLLMVLMAALCLLIQRIIGEFKAGQLRAWSLTWLLVLGMLTSLVKYAFLPIFAAMVVFLMWYGWRNLSWPAVRTTLASSWRALSWVQMTLLIIVVALTSVLFAERYGVNTLRYHTPIADCGQVLSYDECSNYGPWIRNYNYAAQKGDVDTNPFAYTYTWFHDLMYRLFFAVNGPNSNYTNYPPLPVPYGTAAVLFIVSVPLVAWFGRRAIRGQPFLQCSALVLVLYCGALWVEDYSQFVETGVPVAINGRYLIPVLLLAALLIGRCAQLALARWRTYTPLVASVVMVLFLYGGGLATFILRSDATWDWPNATVVEVNNAARKVIDPVIIEGSKYY